MRWYLQGKKKHFNHDLTAATVACTGPGTRLGFSRDTHGSKKGSWDSLALVTAGY